MSYQSEVKIQVSLKEGLGQRKSTCDEITDDKGCKANTFGGEQAPTSILSSVLDWFAEQGVKAGEPQNLIHEITSSRRTAVCVKKTVEFEVSSLLRRRLTVSSRLHLPLEIMSSPML